MLVMAVFYLREAFDSNNNWTALINNFIINKVTTGDTKLASFSFGKRFFHWKSRTLSIYY